MREGVGHQQREGRNGKREREREREGKRER